MTSGKKEQGEELRDVVCSLLNKVRKGDMDMCICLHLI